MTGNFLAFAVSTCRHCGEPVLRPVATGLDVDVWLRWLHTPERAECINQLTRERTGTVAEVEPRVLRMDEVRGRAA